MFAAARCRIFSPQALLGRLQHSLQLLSGGDKDLPSRQQTLHAAIAWSYDLLSAPEQDLFMRLGVFAGGCTLEAAAAIADAPSLGIEPHAGLLALVNASLVRVCECDCQGARFNLFETVREFANEQLEASGELDQTRIRFAAYFLAYAEAAELLDVHHVEVGGGRERLAHEWQNLRTALMWAIQDGDFDHLIG